MASLTLNVGTRWRLPVHVQTALSQGMYPLYTMNRESMDVRTGLDVMEEEVRLLPLPGLEIIVPGHPALS